MELIAIETDTALNSGLLTQNLALPKTKPLITTGQCKFITFSLGAKLYGLSAELVEEISNPLPVTRLPGAPSGVAGIAPLRDEIIAVVDLRTILREQNLTLSNRSKFIIAHSDLAEMRIAIPVDRVREMFECDNEQVDVSVSKQNKIVFGTAMIQDVECHLIDQYKLWSTLWADAAV